MQPDVIDRVIRKTLEVVEQSKYQIFEISVMARDEQEQLEKELIQIMDQIDQMIAEVDNLELKFRHARRRLSDMSRQFNKYTEIDVRAAYEAATKCQMELAMQREKEKALRGRRDELQLRIRNSKDTIDRAENVVSQMDVAHQYLSGDMLKVGELIESARNLQLFGLKVILAQEEERKRIAREIHDGLAQSMAHLVLRSEIAERVLARDDKQGAIHEVRHLKGQIRLGLEDVRKVIFNLRPMALDDLGLVPALRKYVQDFEEKHGLRSLFQMKGKEIRLPSAMEVAVYRFVQEAFSNILKHANADLIEIRLVFEDDELHLLIRDNGIGFDPDIIHDKIKTGEHFGLIGLRERVEMLQGEFVLDSSPGAGTSLKIRVPLAEAGQIDQLSS